MRLNAKILKNVNSVNSWQNASQAYMAEGQPNTLYLQLVDLDVSTNVDTEKSPAFPQNPIRYMSQAAVLSASATFLALVDDEEFSIVGTQPFADDKSIWKFSLSADQVPSSGNLKVTLTEDGVDRSFIVKGALSVETLEAGGC
jgi:hypothetical protein